MFAQANSEHCRHKDLNAEWSWTAAQRPVAVRDDPQHPSRANPRGVLSAYRDNAAVIEGWHGRRWFAPPGGAPTPRRRADRHPDEGRDAQSPDRNLAVPGARPARAGEIRDEGATGRGAKPRLAWWASASQPAHPGRVAVPGSRISEARPHRLGAADHARGPIGAAAFNKRVRRPNIYGYFARSSSAVEFPTGRVAAAGGTTSDHVAATRQHPSPARREAEIVPGCQDRGARRPGDAPSASVAARPSSVGAGGELRRPRFRVVQRGNPEIQRRAQESSTRAGRSAPEPDPADPRRRGGRPVECPCRSRSTRFLGRSHRPRKVLRRRARMSPLEIWCNEAQERYVLIVARPAQLAAFGALCERERLPVSVIGDVTDDGRLRVRTRCSSTCRWTCRWRRCSQAAGR